MGGHCWKLKWMWWNDMDGHSHGHGRQANLQKGIKGNCLLLPPLDLSPTQRYGKTKRSHWFHKSIKIGPTLTTLKSLVYPWMILVGPPTSLSSFSIEETSVCSMTSRFINQPTQNQISVAPLCCICLVNNGNLNLSDTDLVWVFVGQILSWSSFHYFSPPCQSAPSQERRVSLWSFSFSLIRK